MEDEFFDGDFDLDGDDFLEPNDDAALPLSPTLNDFGGPDATEAQEGPAPVRCITDLFPNAEPGTVPVIVGIIAQAKLGAGVDLRTLSCATRNVEFIPQRRTPFATMRLHNPSAVVMVRTSGFMSIIGAASVSEAHQATELAARIIRKALSLEVKTVMFRIRSVMARFDLKHPIRLDALAQHEGVFCSYEPDRFGGCILRLIGKSHGNRWQVSCTVYVTGKVTMVGARSQDELREAFYTLLPIVALYAKI